MKGDQLNVLHSRHVDAVLAIDLLHEIPLPILVVFFIVILITNIIIVRAVVVVADVGGRVGGLVALRSNNTCRRVPGDVRFPRAPAAVIIVVLLWYECLGSIVLLLLSGGGQRDTRPAGDEQEECPLHDGWGLGDCVYI